MSMICPCGATGRSRTSGPCLKLHDVPEEQFARLIATYREHAHKLKKNGLNDDIDAILMTEAD
jgi:hypothetical protein